VNPGALPRRGARSRHGQLISDAEVAETGYTAFTGTKGEVTARLVVRRVKDAVHQDPLFPVWRHHPFLTDSLEPVDQADITHRQHAAIETVWADLIDGLWAHQPSGVFAANAAWAILAAITHNLPRRRNRGRPPLRRRARCDPAPRPGQRPRPPGPTTTATHPAPTHPLAPRHRMEHTLAQRVPDLAATRTAQSATTHNAVSPALRHQARTHWTAQRTNHALTPQDHIDTTATQDRYRSTDRGLEARLQSCRRGASL
jgi:hypothetical protein